MTCRTAAHTTGPRSRTRLTPAQAATGQLRHCATATGQLLTVRLQVCTRQVRTDGTGCTPASANHDTTPTHQVRRVRLRAHRAARRAYLRHGCLRHACLRHACACATPACAMPATPRWPLPVPQCAVARIITARPTLHIPLAFPPSYNRTPDLSFLCA
eukprot:scaffold84895_cov72-Phaeocystis_antarctica.AAC.4